MPGSINITGYAYRATRNAYQRIFNRSYYRERLAIRGFFARHIQRGDLAFDVGSHRGDYAEAFRELGARVVAVEPNPALADALRRRNPGIVVEQAAVDFEEGEGLLHLGLDDNYSTVCTAWAQCFPDRLGATVAVTLTTLDRLIAKHGKPRFLKLDVEGNEAAALTGLSVAVDRVLFEYQDAFPEGTQSAVGKLSSLGDYRFSIPVDGNAWMDADSLLARAYELRLGSGDILARLLRS
jgi:FkbM family methyltransferase